MKKTHNFIVVIYSLAEGEKTKSESTTCTKLWIMMNHLKERVLQRIHNWGVDELQREKPPNMIRKERKKDEVMATRIGGMHAIEYMHHEFIMTQRNQYYASSSYLKVMFTSK
jgi:hypothetical protein